MSWFDFLSPSNIPKSDVVLKYEQLFAQKNSLLLPIDKVTFTVLDTETTGLNVKEDYILSFGAVKLKGNVIHVEKSIELYLHAPLQKNDSVKIHEIMSVEKIGLRDFAQEVLQFIGNDIIVGHHVGFDLLMLEKALKPFGLKKLKNAYIDTASLARRLEHGPFGSHEMEKPGTYSLDTLCNHHNITLDDRHTAAGDAFLTAQLFMKLIKKASQKGIFNIGDLIK
jgi:DNA polymerase III subunit epsilon